MRVALVSPSMRFGGAERLVVDLAAGLVEAGDAVLLSAPSGPLDESLVAGIARHRVPERGRSPAGAVVNGLRLARALARFRPDVVHAHNVKATAVATAAARLSALRPRPRVVATFHGVTHAEYRSAARLLRGADTVACVSADLRDRLHSSGLARERMSVVANGVEPVPGPTADKRAALDRELGLAGRPVVAIVGRLVPQKAHHAFLDAAARLVVAVPDVRVLVVGDGPLRAELEGRAAELALRRHLRFTGARPDARDLIARADLLVFSSDWEGLSIAAIEAMSAGTPVVSTDVEGMRELLASGAGAIVPGGDADALAARIAALLADPDARAAMGAEGRRLAAERYSGGAMVRAYRELYDRP